MNKIELINAVAEETNLSKKDAEAAITAVVNAITGALIEGEKVQLVGFGYTDWFHSRLSRIYLGRFRQASVILLFGLLR